MLKQLFTFLKIEWLQTLEYRADMLFYAFGNSLVPIFGLIIWLAVSSSGKDLPLDRVQLISYYLAVFLVVNITNSWKGYFINEDIKQGNISTFFLKPAHYWVSVFADLWAQKLFRLLFLIPLIIGLGFWQLGAQFFKINFSLITILLFLFSLTMAVVINFMIDMLVGMSGFWIHENRAIMSLDDMFRIFFSGQLIPLIFMPSFIKEIGIFLPYRYIVSFPIEILLSSVNDLDLLLGFSIQAIWMMGLVLIYRIIFAKAIKVYQGFGA